MQLAERGLRVLGLDRLTPPHKLGSSHGHVRLTRHAYYEDPVYVPLVRRATALWQQLSRWAPELDLLIPSGSLMIASPGCTLIEGSLRSAQMHDVPHELLSADEVTRRFPAVQPLDDMVALFEPGSALLRPERIVALQLDRARKAGAALVFGDPLIGWDTTSRGIELRTELERYSAARLVLAVGAWMGAGLANTPLPLQVERQLQHWWTPVRLPDLFTPARMPVTMWELNDGRIFYTMPNVGEGVKVGWHHNGVMTTADTVSRDVAPHENAEIADLLRRFVPLAKGERVAQETCLYTNTPDGHFIIDKHPDTDRVTLVSACSGHGFKFASVIGELVTCMVTGDRLAFDLAPFGLSRFNGL